MEMTGYDIVNIVTPLITLAGGWWIGRRKQKNDFIADLQASIDLLADKNRQLLIDVVKLQTENVSMRLDLNLMIKQCQQALEELNIKKHSHA
jgi:hypothetical protein